MAVIEVKGGHVTRDEDGTWIQVCNNDHRKAIDPIYQAHRYRTPGGRNWIEMRGPFGFVVFGTACSHSR